MQNQKIAIRVQWSWGGSKIVVANTSDEISSTLKGSGFDAINGNQMLIAYKGQILDPSFSFGHYNIKTGSKFVVVLKKIPSKEKSRKFLESMEKREAQVQYMNTATTTGNDPAEVTRREEIARLNDLTFSSWEAMPDFPLVMKEIINAQEEQVPDVVWYPDNSRNYSVMNKFGTVVIPATKINDEPLPNLFEKESIGATGLLKNEFGFSSGFVTDSFAGNGLCEKKH